jgi:DNA/RNA endonuclease YhcR with UshA esterase domain
MRHVSRSSLPSFAVALSALCLCLPPQARADAPVAGKPASAAIPASDAAANVGKTVTVKFTIAHVAESKGNVFLDSQKQRGGFVCFLPHKSHEVFEKAFGEDLKKALEGKTVEVTGEIALYKDAPQIILKSAEQLKIVQ